MIIGVMSVYRRNFSHSFSTIYPHRMEIFCFRFVHTRVRKKYLFLSNATGLSAHKIRNIRNSGSNKDFNSIRKCTDILKTAGYADAIQKHCELLFMNPERLKHKMLFLSECGIKNEKIPQLLVDFQKIFGKKIKILKLRNVIPQEIDVDKNLFCHLNMVNDVTEPVQDDSDTLRTVYLKVLNCYLTKELNADELEFLKKKKKITSLRALRYNLKILKNVIGLSEHKIINNPDLLYIDPESLMLLIRSFEDLNFKEVIKKVPKIALKPRERIFSNYQLLMRYGVSPAAILNYPTLLIRNNDLVERKLKMIQKIPELNAFMYHPNILYLIEHCHIAIQRLEKIKSFSMKRFTLNQILYKKSFDKILPQKSNKIVNADIYNYINVTLNKSKSEIIEALRKNPFLGYTSLQSVQQTLHFLQKSEFKNDDIFFSVQLLLYNKCVVEDAVLNLVPQILESMGKEKSPNVIGGKTYLAMVLYCIEKEYQFSGSGIWKYKETHADELDIYNE